MVDETPESLLIHASKLTDKTDMAQINRRQELYLQSIALSLLKLTAKQETVVAEESALLIDEVVVSTAEVAKPKHPRKSQ